MEDRCQIRLATAADIAAVSAIEQSVFADPWTPSAFHAMLGSHALVAVSNGDIEGYIFARSMADEGEVLNLAVRQGSRRKGLGRRLLGRILAEFAEQGIRTVYLEVRASNSAGRAFYQDMGFREVGRRRAYYSRPREDALVLARELAGEGSA